MNAEPRVLSFDEIALGAFPVEHRDVAAQAAKTLRPFVDDDYCTTLLKMTVSGRAVSIPNRVNYELPNLASLRITGDGLPVVNCLCTRSTGGYIRHAALRNIVESQHREVIPFVVLLAGEYVVEIIDHIVAAVPMLNRPEYANFVRENRATMRWLKARATSYWNEYYRADYRNSATYPGLLFLHEIERWAS